MVNGKRGVWWRAGRWAGLALKETVRHRIGKRVVECDEPDLLPFDVFGRVVSEPGSFGVIEFLSVGVFPVVAPAGVDVENIAGQQAAILESLGLEHPLDVVGGNGLAWLHRRALAQISLRIE